MSLIAWFYCLCSRRMSKSSFVNTNSNPLAQLGRVRSPFCVSEARWASSASFWEIIEVVWRSSAVGSKRILVMKSLSPVLYSTLQIWRRVSSLSESSAYSREGPDQQMLMALASIFFCDACSFHIMRHPSHREGYWFIWTSLVCQLTSGLWSLSQV